MKVFASLLLVSVLVMIAVDAHAPPVAKPKPNVPPGSPTFPGQGPLKPKPSVPGIPTLPGPKPLKPRPSIPSFPNFPGHGSLNPYARPIRFRRSLEEEQSKVHITGGVKKQPGQKPEIKVSGSIRKG